MLQSFRGHQVRCPCHLAGGNGLLLHQVKRPLLNDGRLLAEGDAQLQVAALHLAAEIHAARYTGRPRTSWRGFWGILFHHFDAQGQSMFFTKNLNDAQLVRISLCNRASLAGEGRRQRAATARATFIGRPQRLRREQRRWRWRQAELLEPDEPRIQPRVEDGCRKPVNQFYLSQKLRFNWDWWAQTNCQNVFTRFRRIKQKLLSCIDASELWVES